MKIADVIPFPRKPKPAPVVPIIGLVGADGRVTLYKPLPK